MIWVVETDNAHAMVDLRTTVLALDALGCPAPVVLRRTWKGLMTSVSLCMQPRIWAGP